MAEDSEPVLDLLGDPWLEPRDPRGRKAHKRHPQIAEKVAVLSATGVEIDGIAAQIGLSKPTLRKYYLPELREGPRQAQAVLDEVMWAKAREGNVPAAKYMRERFAAGQAKAPVPMREAAKPKAGKKEIQQADALTAHEGTEWGTLLPH